MTTFLWDVPSNALIKPSFVPASLSATANGTGVDLQACDGPVTGELSVGTHDRTSGDETLTVKYQESNDDGVADAYTDIAGAAHTAIAATGASATSVKQFMRSKRWVRAVATFGGTTPGPTLFGVNIFSQKKAT